MIFLTAGRSATLAFLSVRVIRISRCLFLLFILLTISLFFNIFVFVDGQYLLIGSDDGSFSVGLDMSANRTIHHPMGQS